MKTKPKAIIRYEECWRGEEGYIIIIDPYGKGFEFESFYPLVRREYASADEEQNFVHFSILSKIRDLQNAGYEVTIK